VAKAKKMKAKKHRESRRMAAEWRNNRRKREAKISGNQRGVMKHRQWRQWRSGSNGGGESNALINES
jgi:hypothetical protein